VGKTKRAELRGGLGLFATGLAFFVLTIYLGNDVGWDMTATIGAGLRRGPAWLALPGGLALGIGGMVIGPMIIRQALRPIPVRPPHARRFEGLDGKPLPLESDE